MNHLDYKLDNPVWFALTETHSHLSVVYENIRFYDAEYCTFGAICDEKLPTSGIENYKQYTDTFYIVGHLPSLPDGVYLDKEVKCNQMVLTHLLDDYNLPNIEIIKIAPNNFEELYHLINLVQPGYFMPKTPYMGTYFGIYENGQLVATAGCRIQMNGFTEISSVVTHPDFLRKKYAQILSLHCAKEIIKNGNTPYLHVLETNVSAIALYQKIGFSFRRKMVFNRLKVQD